MDKQVDWSKAPECATHARLDDTKYPWRKQAGLGDYCDWYAWIDGKWVMVVPDASAIYTPRPVTPTWSGEGLPPVGTVCEALRIHHGNGWTKVTILGVGKSRIFWTDDRGEEMSRFISEVQFRPIKTPEQIAAEQREKELCQIEDVLSCIVSRDYRRDAAEALLDAGYRNDNRTAALLGTLKSIATASDQSTVAGLKMLAAGTLAAVEGGAQ